MEFQRRYLPLEGWPFTVSKTRLHGETHSLRVMPGTPDRPDVAGDPFAIDLRCDPNLLRIYYNAEKETGYVRDQNVFRSGIDIYDSMSVLVRYRTGILLNYSLNAFSPREGMRATFNGDRGRIEFYEFGGSHIIRGQNEKELTAEQNASPGEHKIMVYPHFREAYKVDPDPASGEGAHFGSDALLAETDLHEK